MSAEFRVTIEHRNTTLLSASPYQAPLPAGLQATNARAPLFVTYDELRRLTQAAGFTSPDVGPGGALRITGGRTIPDLTIQYENFQQQWQRVSRTDWQFQGGVITFAVTIGVYVPDVFRGNTPAVNEIMGHELLHVHDDIRVAREYMPNQPREYYPFREHLINCRPVNQGSFIFLFRDGGDFQRRMQRRFVLECNRRGNLRHTGPAYDTYQRRITEFLGGRTR